jgi:hypothetical protein
MSKLKMPPNCIDVSAQYRSTVTTLVGIEVFRKQITERRASIHESGHATVGRILGFACGGASITNDGTGSATVAGVLSLHWDFTRSGDILSSVLDKITVCWAGPVAEDIKFGGADDRGDRIQIEQLAARYFVHDRNIERARARAGEILDAHWQDVEIIATALIERKRLSGDDIDALLQQS